PAEVDPRDARGPERRGRPRHLCGSTLLHRPHRRAVHRDARVGSEGFPAQVSFAQAHVKFLWTEFLVLLALVPVLVLLYLLILRRNKRGAVRFASVALAREAMSGSARWRRHLPPAIVLTALVVSILAVARPSAVITLPSQQRTII